ncbi:hypothetical protein [Streptosporangium sp. NPDC000396]|uniref:hypothetical protein n=1 Tax=Streptosporangium sp. NPDC000396 TaxID=3366185 RepID=UPI003679BEA4
MPSPKASLTCYAPELRVYGGTGWMVAKVIVGRRSCHYLVTLSTVEIECQPVNGNQPYAVVDLVLAAARGRVA